jgi:lipopolysaccharide export LptBFGC system permease protein LptF
LPGAEALFGLALGKPEMLSSKELGSQIGTREALGLPVAEQRYELAARYADGLAGAAGALVAAALALRARRRGHINASIVEGVAVAGLLWAADAVFKSLSLGGGASPWACAFAPILLAAGIGLAAVGLQVRKPAA